MELIIVLGLRGLGRLLKAVEFDNFKKTPKFCNLEAILGQPLATHRITFKYLQYKRFFMTSCRHHLKLFALALPVVVCFILLCLQLNQPDKFHLWHN